MEKAADSKEQKKRWVILGAAALAMLILLICWFFFSGISGTVKPAEEDAGLKTNRYNVEVTVLDNGGYTVHEWIDVTFKEKRQGITRHIPESGTITYKDGDGKKQKIPYTAKVQVDTSNVKYEAKRESGCRLLAFGEKDKMVDAQVYDFTYSIRPRLDHKEFHVSSFAVYSRQWPGIVPKGSTFTLNFPKGYSKEGLTFQSEAMRGEKEVPKLLELSYKDNCIYGTLKKDLAAGEGLSFMEEMPEGYFKDVNTTAGQIMGAAGFSFAAFLGVLILFFVYGISGKVQKNVQFEPPGNFDSACTGYILSGREGCKDIPSLLLYWAEKGNLGFRKKQGGLLAVKADVLPKEAPEYQKVLYKSLFGKKPECEIAGIFDGGRDHYGKASRELKKIFVWDRQKVIYDRTSEYVRKAAIALAILPFLWMLVLIVINVRSSAVIWIAVVAAIFGVAGLVMLASVYKYWKLTDKKGRLKLCLAGVLSIAVPVLALLMLQGILALQKSALNYTLCIAIVPAVSVLTVLLSGCIRRHSKDCAKWEGWLAGVQEFVEDADTDRLWDRNEEHPEWFWGLLPYAYAMGLAKEWAARAGELGLTRPLWYREESIIPAAIEDNNESIITDEASDASIKNGTNEGLNAPNAPAVFDVEAFISLLEDDNLS